MVLRSMLDRQPDPSWPFAAGAMADRFRVHNWAATPLGPPAGWSERLRLMVEQLFATPLASVLVCGPQCALIFNDAAIHLDDHSGPLSLGRPAAEAWPSMWPILAPHCGRAFKGEAIRLAASPSGREGSMVAATAAMMLLPVREEDGEVTYVQVTCLSDDEEAPSLRDAKERQRQSLIEMQRRLRNILAVVRAIVARTSKTSDDVEAFASHLIGRIDAVARTQTLLTLVPDASVDLEALVREELLAQAAPEERLDVGGPDVRLPAKAAEVLTLALHELGTNAVKYGALAGYTGRVSVSWTVNDEGGARWLTLVWEETGVRVAALAPRRVGFGTELIEQRIAYELRGRGALELQPGGMRCIIAVPVV